MNRPEGQGIVVKSGVFELMISNVEKSWVISSWVWLNMIYGIFDARSFIQQIFIVCILCARQHSWH